MGYSTQFSGEIRITNIDLDRVRHLQKFMGMDKRDIDPQPQVEFYHFDIELNEDLSALQWDGSEKTYAMKEMLNFLRVECDLEFAEGDKMFAQGEDFEDRYVLVVKDGKVVTKKLTVGDVIECPDCGHRWEA